MKGRGGRHCSWGKVIKDKLASSWPVSPGGGTPGGVFSLRVVFGSFSKLVSRVHFEEPNLVVLFCCLSCFPTEYAGVESDNETEPVPVASAGCRVFLSVHYRVSFKYETSVHSTSCMKHPNCILVPDTIRAAAWPYAPPPLLHGILPFCPVEVRAGDSLVQCTNGIFAFPHQSLL